MATLKTTNLRNRIDDTKNHIAKLFVDQLQNGVLSNAANLTNDKQLVSICKWLVHL